MLALKLLLRNWRSGELKLLTLALIIAIAVVSGISVFVARLEASLELQTAELLGGDYVVISPSPHPQAWRQEAERRGIKHVNFIRMQTMAYKDVDSALVSLQVVADGYPLRGSLSIAEQLPGPDQVKPKGKVTSHVPAPGEIWVGADLFLRLQINLGARLDVGEASFIVSKVLTDSPEPFSRFPIVMMNYSDLASTQIIQPGSQIDYRWLFATDDKKALADFVTWLEPQLYPQQEISDAHSRSDWLKRTVQQSGNVLSFSAVISVLLAGVAISIATRQFVERHISQVAVKKSFGATSKRIRQLYMGQLLILGLLASLIGVLLGHLMQGAIAEYLQRFIDFTLAPSSVWPYVLSLLSGLGFLLLFALPPLWHLPDVPPLRVLRNDLDVNKVRLWEQVVLAGLAVFALIALFSKDLILTVKVCATLLIVILLTLIFARMTLWLSKKLARRLSGFWRLGMVNLQRRHQHNTLLIAVFSTTLMALLSLTLLRNAFWDEIQDYASLEEVNFFILNVSNQQKPEVEAFLDSLPLKHDGLLPTLVGRVTQVNGNTPPKDKEEFWVFNWDVWMTWFDTLPEQQTLIEGQWWPDLPQGEEDIIWVSVREDIMQEGDFKLGDLLTFSISGESQVAKITSVRPNIVSEISMPFVFQPDMMQDFYHIYNMGLNVPPQHKQAIYGFARQYPTIVIESLDAWLEKTQRILKQALDGALFVLLITLLCGCLVLFAAVNSSIASRRQESGLLRAFGSGKKLILGSVWVEFVAVGSLSGLIAVVASEILFHQLQLRMSDVPFLLHSEYWLPVIVGGAATVSGLGILACRSTVSTPPGQVLRNA